MRLAIRIPVLSLFKVGEGVVLDAVTLVAVVVAVVMAAAMEAVVFESPSPMKLQ